MTVTSDRDLNSHPHTAATDGHLNETEVDDLTLVQTLNPSIPMSEGTEEHLLEGHLPVQETEIAVAQPHAHRSRFQWFANLPIWRKQLLGLFLAELISIGGIAGVGAWLTVSEGRAQVKNQAKSELTVTQFNYENKAKEISVSLDGLAGNAAIIRAAKTYGAGNPLTAELLLRVKTVLQDETYNRFTEYATLVDTDMKIVSSPNALRQGEVFNPNNLVSEVLKTKQPVSANAVVTWEELQKELPPLPPGFKNKDALIQYTVTPVRDPNSLAVIGALISGNMISAKLPIMQQTVDAFSGGYSAIYQRQADKTFALATALNQSQGRTKRDVSLENLNLVEQAAETPGKVWTERARVGDQTYTLAAMAITDANRQPIAVLVRGTPETAVNELITNNLSLQLGVAVLALLVAAALSYVLQRAIVKPIEELKQAAQDYAEGERDTRAPVFATDEVGQLAETFNIMADNINASADALEAQSNERQAEAEQQRSEKEQLQKGVITLLLDIEGAQQGDLTTRAKVDDTEMGSIADAFNATIKSLRNIVTQVKSASSQVQGSAVDSQASVEKLTQEAATQAQVVAEALTSVGEMDESVKMVAVSAQEAADIARQALAAAEQGTETMDLTVGSIENIRTSVADTSKKVKRLADSSQEISKIINIISGISEKTNLLAFNASIEAARAGEHGEGFRVVADEVRRLAERVTSSTKEIEQQVTAIQEETAEVLQTMEGSTNEVVKGTALVAETKETLQGLAQISQKINHLLQSISTSTVSQTEASQLVNQTMQDVAGIAETTSSESKTVAESMQSLVALAEQLQGSVARFQVE